MTTHVRRVVDEDLPAIARIATANDDEADPHYVFHLRDNGRFLVAEVNGDVTGYCATRPVAGATMLTDLFVDPARHSRGVGRRLLDVALDGAGELFTFASRDPRAISLYVRRGMVPRWPLLYLSGSTGGQGTLHADRVTPKEAAEAESALTGHDRGPDYAFWATFRGATGLLVRDGDSIVAAGAAGDGRLQHLVTADTGDPAATLTAALGTFGTGRVSLCLPGPHPALPSLLEAGWHIEDLDQHLAARPDLLNPASVLSASLA